MKRLAMTLASATAAVLCLALPGHSGMKKSAGVAKAPQAAAAPKPTAAKDQGKLAVARVNGVAITRDDLERATKVMLAQNGVEQQLTPEATKKASEAALEQLTMAELIYQEAVKVKVADVAAKVDRKIAESKAAYPSEQAFLDALTANGLTVEEMTGNVHKGILIAEFLEQRFSPQAQVTEAEAEKFYRENEEKYFTRPESVAASHILVKSEEKEDAQRKKQAREKAEGILKRIKGGEDFAALAKAESDCPSKETGGDLGSFGRGQTVEAFEQAVFALKPGEISGVVESSFGFHIIKLADKRESDKMSYADAKQKITEHLKKEKMRNLVSAFVEELRSKAKIEHV